MSLSSSSHPQQPLPKPASMMHCTHACPPEPPVPHCPPEKYFNLCNGMPWTRVNRGSESDKLEQGLDTDIDR